VAFDLVGTTAALVSDPLAVGLLFAGLLLGLLFGSIPGLNTLTLAAALLPVSVYLSSTQAVVLFGAIYVSGVYGGALSAILFNIPGSVENAPTAFDGYPMTQRGEAAKAVRLAIQASAIGGTASVVLMIAGTEWIARWATASIGPLEKLGIILFALAVIGGVGSTGFWKKWISLALGLLLGTVGTDPVGGIDRFAFGNLYLQSGIGFSVLILGFFAVTEVLVQGGQNVQRIRNVPELKVHALQFAELWRMRVTVARSAVIGFLVGVLPGAGAALAAFLSYSEAVRWSRHPERFGHGEPEGVVASETANNAATGGAMIPLLALGLPGGAFTAIMLGVLELHDLTPGPLLFQNNRELVYALYAAMFIGSVLILLLGLIETRFITKLLAIPFPILGTLVIVFCVIGAYSLRNNIIDVWTMLVAGIVGYALRSRGYLLSNIVLGVILGQFGEEAFYQSMQLVDYNLNEFVRFPFALAFMALAIITMLFNVMRELRRGNGSSTRGSASH